MSTANAQAIEFRCTTCWQSNFAAVEEAGEAFGCPYCQAEMKVPEATPDRLRTAEQIAEPVEQPVNPYSTSMSDAELMKVVQSENLVAGGGRDFGGYPLASLMSRFCASFLDGMVLVVAFVVGVFAMLGAAQAGLVAPMAQAQESLDLLAMAILYFFPLAACIIQWNMITTRGQSLGKLVMQIRIVSVDGSLPGFVSGVILRNWVRNLLGFIPLFGLIDILFIFGSSQRCIHDYLAGTRVVQA